MSTYAPGSHLAFEAVIRELRDTIVNSDVAMARLTNAMARADDEYDDLKAIRQNAQNMLDKVKRDQLAMYNPEDQTA